MIPESALEAQLQEALCVRVLPEHARLRWGAEQCRGGQAAQATCQLGSSQ